MSDADNHLIIDGLQIGNYFHTSHLDHLGYHPQRRLFEEWRKGALDCVHVTCVVWENARQSLSTVARWYRAAREHADLFIIARSADDVLRARKEGKTAVLLGAQNTSSFEDDLSMVEVFHALGLRVAQLTYNIQNYVGASCYEKVDAGLTRFGKSVIKEMNRVGMAVDLSHVGYVTSLQAIEHSERPVAITHSLPKWVHEHPRNIPDNVLQALSEAGGVIGLATYPALMGSSMNVTEFCDVIKRLCDQIGVEHVALGSDLALDWTTEDAFSMTMGRWTHEPEYGAQSKADPGWPELPSWLKSPADFPSLSRSFLKNGFSDEETGKIMGGNWLRFFSESLDAGTVV